MQELVLLWRRKREEKKMERALHIISVNVRNIYLLNVSTATKCLRKIWEMLGDRLVENCWRNTGNIYKGLPELNAEILNIFQEGKEVLEDMVVHVTETANKFPLTNFY